MSIPGPTAQEETLKDIFGDDSDLKSSGHFTVEPSLGVDDAAHEPVKAEASEHDEAAHDSDNEERSAHASSNEEDREEDVEDEEDEELSAQSSANEEDDDEDNEEEEELSQSASAHKESSAHESASASASKEEPAEEKKGDAVEEAQPFEALGKVVASLAQRKQQAIAAKAEADNKAAEAKNTADEKAAAAHATTDTAGLPADQKLAEAKEKHKDQAAEEERKRLAAEAKNRVDHGDAKKLAAEAKTLADEMLPSIHVTAQATLDAEQKANDDAANAAAEHKKVEEKRHQEAEEVLGKVVKKKTDFASPTLEEPLGKVAPPRGKLVAAMVKKLEDVKVKIESNPEPTPAAIAKDEKADKPVKALVTQFETAKTAAKDLSASTRVDLKSATAGLEAKEEKSVKIALK